MPDEQQQIHFHDRICPLSSIENIELHLIASAAGFPTLSSELNLNRKDVADLADHVHSDRDVGATVASGSFKLDAMIVAPCSMKSLASIATGVSGTLVARAADVTLKERRRLVLLARETPLNLVHLRNMVTVTEMGGVIYPPVAAYYNKPKSLDDIIDETVGRILALCGVATNLVKPWPGMSSTKLQQRTN
jgi:4-hydroxy-3-polyprenylbenzoate decarboxylase